MTLAPHRRFDPPTKRLPVLRVPMASRLCAAIGVMVVAPPLWAQASTAGPGPHITLGLNVAHDSNALRLTDSAAGQRADVIWTPSLAVDVTRSFGRTSFALTGTLGYTVYDRFRQFNATTSRVEGSSTLHIGSRCSLRAMAVGSRALATLTESSGADVGRNIVTTRTGQARVECSAIGGLHPQLGWQRDLVRNTATTLRGNDNQTDTTDAALTLARSIFGELGGTVRLRQTVFSHPATASAERLQILELGGRWTRSFGAHLDATTSATYTRVETPGQTATARNGLSWQTGLVLRPSTRSQISTSYGRQAEVAGIGASGYAIATTVQCEARWKPSLRTALILTAQDIRRSYGTSAASLVPGQPGREHASVLTANLSYAPPLHLLRSAIAFDLGTSVSRRTSDSATLNAHDVITSLSVRVTS